MVNLTQSKIFGIKMSWNLSDDLQFEPSTTMTEEKAELFVDYIHTKAVNIYKGNYYNILFTTIKTGGLFYNCAIKLHQEDFDIKLYSEEYSEIFTQPINMVEFDLNKFESIEPFLKIEPFENETSIQTTNQQFPILVSSLFDTILELVFRIYCFFNIEEDILSDIAIGYCPDNKFYYLRMYRILATQKPVDDLSIYRKRFGYKYTREVSQDKLDKIRNIKMSEVLNSLLTALRIKRNQTKFYLFNKYKQDKDKSVYEFFSELCKLDNKQLSNCSDCVKWFDEIENMTLMGNVSDWVSNLNEVYKNSSELIREKRCKNFSDK